MAKKAKVNKSQAVRDYLKANPGAMSGAIAAALNKQGIKITAAHVASVPAVPSYPSCSGSYNHCGHATEFP